MIVARRCCGFLGRAAVSAVMAAAGLIPTVRRPGKFARLLQAAVLVIGIGGASATLAVVVSSPAIAATTPNPDYNVDFGYPWSDAQCAWKPHSTAGPCSGYDWGYKTCPAGDGYCSACPRGETVCNAMVNGYYQLDDWGYGFRNCTSYVAWQLSRYGVPSGDLTGLGNGGSWYTNAKKKKLPTGTTPEVGAAAVVPGDPGHVALITAYNPSNGDWTVQEYNYNFKGVPDTWTGEPSARGFTEYVYFAKYMTNPPTPWTPTEAKLPSGVSNATSASLWSVACPSASACVAAGDYYTADGGQVPLLLTGYGSSWTAATAKLPAAADPNGYAFVTLNAVACASASRCVAVGSYNDSSGASQGLLVSGYGSSWTAVTVPSRRARRRAGLPVSRACPHPGAWPSATTSIRRGILMDCC